MLFHTMVTMLQHVTKGPCTHCPLRYGRLQPTQDGQENQDHEEEKSQIFFLPSVTKAVPNQRCCLQSDSNSNLNHSPSRQLLPQHPTNTNTPKLRHRSPQHPVRGPSCPRPSAELSHPPADARVPCTCHGMALRRICSEAFPWSELRLPGLRVLDHPSHRAFLCTAVPSAPLGSARTSPPNQECCSARVRGVLDGCGTGVTVPLRALQFPVIGRSGAGTDSDDTGLGVEQDGFIPGLPSKTGGRG
nr:uncharacterized protein LOC115497498 [Taeniopygia guttata]